MFVENRYYTLMCMFYFTKQKAEQNKIGNKANLKSEDGVYDHPCHCNFDFTKLFLARVVGYYNPTFTPGVVLNMIPKLCRYIYIWIAFHI